MKKLLLFILPLLAITLNSCSDSKGYQWPKYDRLVKRFAGMEFEYDKLQRITRVIWDNGEFLTCIYEDNRVTIKKGDSYTTYTFDDNGYGVRIDHENGDFALCEYLNGYLHKVKYVNSNGDIELEETFTWVNGNRVKDYYNEEAPEALSVKHSEFNQVEDKLSINFWGLRDRLWFPKLKGTFSKNYPIKVATTYEGETYECKYEYTYDSDGYPTKIIMTDTDGETYTHPIIYY